MSRFVPIITGGCSLVGSIVIPMTWTTINPTLGYFLIALVVIGYAVAAWLWLKEYRRDFRIKSRATDKIPYVRIHEIALAKGIDLPRYGEMQNRSYDLEGELKNAAANGLLAVWGRPYNGEPRDNDPMLPIPAEHFRKYSFRHGCLEMDMENKHSCTTTIAALTKGKEMTEGESYYDLQLSDSDARAVLRQSFGLPVS